MVYSKTFWNAQAEEHCSNPQTVGYLKSTKAIEGAISTKWILIKTQLLELLADELSALVNEVCGDLDSQRIAMNTVETNKKKNRGLTDILIAEKDAENQDEDRIDELMKDLRHAQSALKKAIDRKQGDLDKIKFMSNSHLLTAGPPEPLPLEEVNCIVAYIHSLS